MNQKKILEYEGIITQKIISNNIEKIESLIENMGTMGKVATIAIEFSQNMMTYSKTPELNSNDILSKGHLEIIKDDENTYSIISKNIISAKDKQKIEEKLTIIKSLDASGIKKQYKELRRSGKNMHDNNGGIGFFEVAKQASNLEYEFTPINEEKYYFSFKAIVESKQK